jgi:hypothetical protein
MSRLKRLKLFYSISFWCGLPNSVFQWIFCFCVYIMFYFFFLIFFKLIEKRHAHLFSKNYQCSASVSPYSLRARALKAHKSQVEAQRLCHSTQNKRRGLLRGPRSNFLSFRGHSYMAYWYYHGATIHMFNLLWEVTLRFLKCIASQWHKITYIISWYIFSALLI